MSRTVPLPTLDGRPEFPGYADVRPGDGEAEAAGLDRRGAMRLMAASAALAGVGVSGCRRPEMEIRPFTRPPEDQVPGLPTFYATTLLSTPTPAAVVVEDDEGRPTKVEGNPLHPYSLGATDAFAQAAVLDLYHPDRSRNVLRNGEPVGWDAWDAADLAGHVGRLPEGKGLAFLTDGAPSPAMRLLREHVAAARPGAAWYEYRPIDESNRDAGTKLAFGEPLVPTFLYDAAKRVVSLDADFLGTDGDVISQRRFARGRRPGPDMSRLYCVETTYTVTGGAADHRLRVPASYVTDYAIALAGALARLGAAYDPAVARAAGAASAGQAGVNEAWVRAAAKDLFAHKGAALVVAGRRQPPLVHALAHAMTAALGGVGKTVTYVKPPEGPPAQQLHSLYDATGRGEVDTLVILQGNPAYVKQAHDMPFAESLLVKVKSHIVRLSQFEDETSHLAGKSATGSLTAWHVPATHDLEQWGDAEMPDGTYSPVQPLIDPLVPRAMSPWELVARLTRYEKADGYAIARASFAKRSGTDDEAAFRKWLHEGVLAGSSRPAVTPRMSPALAEAVGRHTPADAVTPEKFEVSFHPCYRLYDGRYAGNAWLQELPDPITKLTWDNAAYVSPATANTLVPGQSLSSGDLIRLRYINTFVDLPVFVLHGQADNTVSVQLGHGRRYAGRVGSVLQRDADGQLLTGEEHGGGADVYPLRYDPHPYFGVGYKVEKLYGTYKLAATQSAFTQQHGREIVKRETAAGLKHPHAHEHHAPADLSEIVPLDDRQGWGMVIDLTACTGCSACMVACQAENNVPVVGKDEVARGREMHWIRLDRYFLTDDGHTNDNPGLAGQPVACVHCERAPCELVCPVNAAVHSPEGLNLQVYNRCIGTRYCSNNCPYKARRFNWFDYNQRPLDALRLGPLAEKGTAELLKMRNNPDVTVRMRGVMEKCTYCVQRIERAKIGAKLAASRVGSLDFRVPDGAITPACAQACPAGAIVFGNVKDPDSRVSKLRKDPRGYGLLDEELNVRPRTTYLSRVSNPNPELKEAVS